MTEHEQAEFQKLKVIVGDLLIWKVGVNDLFYGDQKGALGYFYKSNFMWRMIILWPFTIASIAFGSVLTIAIQHWIRGG